MKYFFTVIIACLTNAPSIAQSNTLPFLLVNEQQLSSYKQQYLNKDKSIIIEIDSIIADADKALKAGPYSVTLQKTKLPPSGDMHDYVSQAPYWWPDTSKPDGKPYIIKDGRINPERNTSKDYGQMGRMCNDVKILALAYYFTGEESYSKKATELLKAWFIDTATRMNPHLNYGQFIPGKTEGRGVGIIETVALSNIPDAMAMMQGSNQMNNEFITGIKGWFASYTDWLLNSKNGKEEKAAGNNHGTYYDMQLIDFALFTGKRSIAEQELKEQTISRIEQQFTIDGAQPQELARTKSWNYSTMNLTGWCKLAILADHVNIDLWHKTTIDGKGIHKVFEWFVPYVTKEKQWNYEQIEPISYNNIMRLYQLAAAEYPGDPFQKLFETSTVQKLQRPWW